MSTSSRDRLPRKRARVACVSCNQRKVKCDVTATGVPCTNCSRDATLTCQTPQHKRQRSPRIVPRGSRNLEEEGSASLQVTDRIDISPSSLPLNRNHSTLTQANGVVAESAPYIGDHRGARPYVYELVPSPSLQTATSPQYGPTLWSQPQIAYLQCEGAFTTLHQQVTKDLLNCYFDHVHFFLPILDAQETRSSFEAAPHGQSYLLYWSIMLAAANFITPESLLSTGFASRKELKTAIYSRCKALYDLDTGTDKIILIQAVTLMSFWYTDSQDHTGAWHWVGIAISLSQQIGLHRDKISRNSAIRRRIWWSLVIRDRWLSLAKGLPMRVYEGDCDVVDPSVDHVLDDFAGLSASMGLHYRDAKLLATIWVGFVKISVMLGRILRTHYGANATKQRDTTGENLDVLANALGALSPAKIEGRSSEAVVISHMNHLELYFSGVKTVLFRPYVLGPQDGAINGPKAEDSLARARASAAHTNAVLESMIDGDAIHLLKPMAITAIIPAMQIHLHDCSSAVSTRQALGRNKLELCLVVLSMLRDTYWSANVTARLFQHALDLLDQSKGLAGRKASDLWLPRGDELSATLGPSSSIAPPAPLGLDASAGSDLADIFGNSQPNTTFDIGQLLDPTFSLPDENYSWLESFLETSV